MARTTSPWIPVTALGFAALLAACGGSSGTVTTPNAATSQLPAGATGIVCDYHASTDNVIIEVIVNIPGSYISAFSSHFPVGFAPVSGVGDQARSFHQALGGGKDNEGVVATKGTTLVVIDATATPATLSQIESYINSLF